MNDLRQDFLRQSVSELENLSGKLRGKNLSENLLRGVFRQIHTIKGTAQTFGFGEAARAAHELENLLQAARENKFAENEDFISLLREAIALLAERLTQAEGGEKQAKTGRDLLEKIKQKTENIAATPLADVESSLRLPPEILSQLSGREKRLIDAAIENGRNLFLIEAGFVFAHFDTDFKNFDERLEENGEKLAVFPSRKFAAADRVGFQFFFVTEKDIKEISSVIAPFDGEIIYKVERDRKISAADNLEDVLRQTTNGAQKIAEKLDKKVSLDVSLETSAELPVWRLKLIFDILLHLTRNAIDHAFEKSGKIEILLSEKENHLRLVFSDDGKGIDLDKVKAKALEKNLIFAGKSLTEAETLDLIFLPELSTASDVTEISGRGVGLDAVKNAVENAGGTIGVKSKRSAGTTFEIILPNEK